MGSNQGVGQAGASGPWEDLYTLWPSCKSTRWMSSGPITVTDMESYHQWGGSVLGSKSVAHIAKPEKAKIKELATKLGQVYVIELSVHTSIKKFFFQKKKKRRETIEGFLK